MWAYPHSTSKLAEELIPIVQRAYDFAVDLHGAASRFPLRMFGYTQTYLVLISWRESCLQP